MRRLTVLLAASAVCLWGGCAARQGGTLHAEPPGVAAGETAAAGAGAESSRPLRGVVLSIGREHRQEELSLFGTHVLACDLHDAIDLLPLDIRPGDVVVLHVDSDGGPQAEAMRIARVVRQRLVPTYQTVAWVEYAIGRAMVVPAASDRVVMMPDSLWGGFSCEFWGPEIPSGEKYWERLEDYKRFDGFTWNDRAFLHAATMAQGLSALKLNGEIVLFPDATSGELEVHPQGEAALVGPTMAWVIGLSEGTANDLAELEDILVLGEIEWAGQQRANEWWPLSHAERLIRDRMFEHERQYQKEMEAQHLKWMAEERARISHRR